MNQGVPAAENSYNDTDHGACRPGVFGQRRRHAEKRGENQAYYWIAVRLEPESVAVAMERTVGSRLSRR